MPIKVTCPKCQGVLHAPDDAGGKRGKCPTCQTVLSIPADAQKVASSPPSPVDNPFRNAGRDAEEETGGSLLPPSEPKKPIGGVPSVRPSDPVRGSAAGSRLAAPYSMSAQETRPAVTDPFSKPNKQQDKASADASSHAATEKAWRRTRGGLWWVQAGYFLILLSILGVAGIAIAENYGVKLPEQKPGYLQHPELSSSQEIRVAVAVIPLILGLLFINLGRFGAANAPRTAHTKGLARMSGIATFIGIMGLAAALAIGVSQALDKTISPPLAMAIGTNAEEPVMSVWSKISGSFLPADEITGQIERLGLLTGGVFLLLGNVWFTSAIGRIATALNNPTAAGRSTRYHIYSGLIFALLVIAGVGYWLYSSMIDASIREHLQSNWDKLAEHRATARCGIVILIGIIWWLISIRLVGSARRAIRKWQEDNEMM